jgi:hypothetical protein
MEPLGIPSISPIQYIKALLNSLFWVAQCSIKFILFTVIFKSLYSYSFTPFPQQISERIHNLERLKDLPKVMK